MSILSTDCLARRLDNAGLDVNRFVDVIDGRKGTYDHTLGSPDSVDGNYGIYAREHDRLAIVDIDDYDEGAASRGLNAIKALPETLEQESPHGGRHRFYAVERDDDGRYIAAVLDDELDVQNPTLSWGEVRVANQYVVGAGSSVDGCEKDWCDACATEDGGVYTLRANRPIAFITPVQLIHALREDPTYTASSQSAIDTNTADVHVPNANAEWNPQDVLEYAFCESDDEKLRRLWRGDYSDYDGDRSRAEAALASKLAFWLQGDKQAVRRAMNGQNLPEDVPPPDLPKWEERPDDSYRESVLSAVDKQTTYFGESA